MEITISYSSIVGRINEITCQISVSSWPSVKLISFQKGTKFPTGGHWRVSFNQGISPAMLLNTCVHFITTLKFTAAQANLSCRLSIPQDAKPWHPGWMTVKPKPQVHTLALECSGEPVGGSSLRHMTYDRWHMSRT